MISSLSSERHEKLTKSLNDDILQPGPIYELGEHEEKSES